MPASAYPLTSYSLLAPNSEPTFLRFLLTSSCSVASLIATPAIAGAPLQDISADDFVAVDAALGIRRPYTDCISGGGPTTAAMLRCAHDEFIFQDKRLNDVYRTLMARLGVQDKSALRSAESAWIVDKERRCALPVDPGTTDQVTSADCAVRETAQRATELEKRLHK
jgi:uncharacterized protein YecT (DUF1311 family)